MAEEKTGIDNDKIVNDDELLKALETILGEGSVSKDDIITKGEESEKDKEDNGDEDDDEMQKAHSKVKAEYDEMQKALEMKKGELEEYESKMKKKEVKKAEDDDIQKGDAAKEDDKPEEEIKKSESEDLIKSFQDTLGSINKALEDQKADNDEIKKSLETVTKENEELKKSLDEIGQQRPGMKSLQSEHFIEKGGENLGEDGSTLLSISNDKAKVESLLEKAIDEADNDSLKKSLSSDLLTYNMGGAPLSENTARYLYKTQKVRLQK